MIVGYRFFAAPPSAQMADSQIQAEKERRVGESVEERIVNLLDGLLRCNASVKTKRRLSKFFLVERLLNFASDACGIIQAFGGFGCHLDSCKYYRSNMDPSISSSRSRPGVRLTEFMNLHEERTLCFLSIDPETYPEHTAWMYELLEASWFESDATDVRSPQLNFFRMAQKIRDEHGITRENSSLPCFKSLEDIILLEKKLADDDPVDFMVQCVLLAKDMPTENMYFCLRTFSLLEAFHEEMYQLGRLDEQSYVYQFGILLEESALIPPWCQLEKFLELSSTLVIRDEIDNPAMLVLFGAEIPRRKIDEAFRIVTDYLIRCFGVLCKEGFYGELFYERITSKHTAAALETLRWLLSKGARLDFRAPHEILHFEQSSLGALVELADLVPIFPLEELFPFICCPLAIEEGELGFDRFRPARLACLAARSVGALKKCSPLPNSMRSWTRMHQELDLHLKNKDWRVAALKKRVLDKDTEDPAIHFLYPASKYIKNLPDWRREFSEFDGDESD